MLYLIQNVSMRSLEGTWICEHFEKLIFRPTILLTDSVDLSDQLSIYAGCLLLSVQCTT